MAAPSFIIKFKDESLLMKMLGKILFFNKNFMTNYTTTIGNNIYFPTRQWLKVHPVAARVILLHELVHIKDAEKISRLLFSFLYLAPQIFVFLAIPLMFIHWWLGLFCLLFLIPIPAYFRMAFEKKAYTFSIYTMNKLNDQYNYNINFDQQIDFFTKQFTNSYYYFMWPFTKSINEHFVLALHKFQSGEKPFYEAEYYEMIDNLVSMDVKIIDS